MKTNQPDAAIRLVASNKKAGFEYFIDERIEAGIVLAGTEVKSLRAGRGSLTDSFARIENGEAWLLGCHVAPYEAGNRFNKDEKRPRKLLLHKGEIRRLAGKLSQKGYTLVPVRLYFKGGRVKVELGLARGKKLYDKREAIQRRDEKRLADREERQRIK